MTTYFQFIKNNKQAPSFMPMLDGNNYNVTVIWNVSARRYYISCQTIEGALIFFVPLIESMVAIPLTAIEYDEQNSRVKATISGPIPFPVGNVCNINIINNEPTGYNGSGLSSVLSPTEFIYNLTSNPGLNTVLGAVEILASMTKGYFASTLIFRNGQFEVDP